MNDDMNDDMKEEDKDNENIFKNSKNFRIQKNEWW